MNETFNERYIMFLHESVILSTGGRVVSQHAFQVSRPTLREEVEGSGWGSLQAHTQGEVEGSGWGGVFRPTPRGCVCIPACTEADTPQQTATAAGGTHPTGMHSCNRM